MKVAVFENDAKVIDLLLKLGYDDYPTCIDFASECGNCDLEKRFFEIMTKSFVFVPLV